MINVFGVARITKDIEVRYAGDNLAIASFSIVNNRKDTNKTPDFFNAIAFGKTAESLEKYCRKGTKIAFNGTIQNDSYTNKDGKKVTTTKIIITEWEFAEGKSETEEKPSNAKTDDDGFMVVPDISSEELPFD